jgi:FtsP/CotA-like multicopper oxidase with cupredoxin domain
LKENFIFPKFPQGTKVVEVLNEAMYMDGDDEYLSGALIGGTFLHMSRTCQGSTFEVGKTYDFHIVNLTPDSHPLHFHLVNFQKIYAY